MSAMAELWHILKKDVREFRWLLVAYAMLVVIATVSATTGGALANGYLQLGAVMLLVVGPIAAAMVVQADSPVRADAFWASHPFRRGVMLAAKLTLAIGFILLLPLIGQLLALVAFDVPARDVGGLLGVSAIIYGLVLLIAMFLAALTSDLRSFVLSVVGLLIAMLVMGLLVSEAKWSWGTPASHGVVVALALAGVLFLFVLLYIRRDVRAARPIGTGLLALMLLGGVSGSDSAPAAPEAGDVATTQPGTVGIAVELRDTALITDESRVYVQVSLTGDAGSQRYRLDHPQARFFLNDGTAVDIPLPELGASLLSTGPMVLPEAPVIQQDDNDFLGPTARTQRFVRSDDRRALMRGIDSVRLTTRLTAYASDIFATLPMRAGADFLRDGQAVRIEDTAPGYREGLLSLHVVSVGRTSDIFNWVTGGGVDAVLVNRKRGEGVALSRTGSSTSPGLLVLPGTGVHQGTIRYIAAHTRNGDLHSDDAEWLNGAQLVLVKWKPTRSYTVSATNTPSPPDGRPRDRIVSPFASSAPSQPLKAHR